MKTGGIHIVFDRRDGDVATELREQLAVLAAAGELHDVASVDNGESVESALTSVEAADVVVLLLSHSLLSTSLLADARLARLLTLRSDRVVVPVLLDDCDVSTLPWLPRARALPRHAVPLRLHTADGHGAVLVEVAQVSVDALAAQHLRRLQVGPQGTALSLAGGKVFISYADEDGTFADLLYEKLRSGGLQPWIDRDGIVAGRNWQEAIDRAIDAAVAVVLVVSPASRDSEYVTYEWAYALGRGTTVIPVMLQPRDEILHPRLRNTQRLDFSNRRQWPWDALLDALRAIT